jgi:hypothetical protein
MVRKMRVSNPANIIPMKISARMSTAPKSDIWTSARVASETTRMPGRK